jgi:hypothetical protein
MRGGLGWNWDGFPGAWLSQAGMRSGRAVGSDLKVRVPEGPSIFNYFFRGVGVFGGKGPWILGIVGVVEK